MFYWLWIFFFFNVVKPKTAQCLVPAGHSEIRRGWNFKVKSIAVPDDSAEGLAEQRELLQPNPKEPWLLCVPR